MSTSRVSFSAALLLLLGIATPPLLSGADLIVTVASGGKLQGDVGCALYRSADGFPMNDAKAAAKMRVKPATDNQTAECRFAGVSPGPFAVAVSVDVNGNQKPDKNFLGIPTEPWGVSNNVRPGMRAPRFEEAAGTMPASGEDLRIAIKVQK